MNRLLGMTLWDLRHAIESRVQVVDLLMLCFLVLAFGFFIWIILDGTKGRSK